MLGFLIVSTLVGFSFERELVWFRTFGGSDAEESTQCIECFDGGFALVGTSSSFSDAEDIWLVKTDPSGYLEWSESYGGSSFDYGVSVHQMIDSGFLIAGSTYSFGAGQADGWLLRTDSSGVLLWDMLFGTADEDWIRRMSACPSGGFIAVGAQGVYPSDMKVWLVRLDSDGNVVWEETYGGGAVDEGFDAVQTSDGGYIVAGKNESQSSGSADGWLIRCDSLGAEQWDLILGGPDYDRFNQVRQTSDGGFIAAGTSYSSSGPGTSDLWLVKVDEFGSVEWDSLIGQANGNEAVEWIDVQMDGSFRLACRNSSLNWPSYDLWVVETDGTGKVEWDFAFGGSEDDCGTCLTNSSDGGIVVCGWSRSYGAGDKDFLLVKILQPQGIGTEEVTPQCPDLSLVLSPNPFVDYSTARFEMASSQFVALTLHDITGRLMETVFSGQVTAGIHSQSIDVSSYPPGVYELRLKTRTLVVSTLATVLN